MKPGGKAKYDGYVTRLNKFVAVNPPPRGEKYAPEVHVKFYAEDDKIIIKFMLIFPETISGLRDIQIPIGLKEGLKDVDQFVKVKVLLGVDAHEVLASDKPIAEHYLKGVSAQVDV